MDISFETGGGSFPHEKGEGVCYLRYLINGSLPHEKEKVLAVKRI
jgi:hypothetical protein